MTKEEKIAFIKQITDEVATYFLGFADKMPEEWDGMELRVLLAEEFWRLGRVAKRSMDGRGKRGKSFASKRYEIGL